MPVIDVANFFRASSKSVRNLFVEAGAAFYIPAYQRQYRWEKENVKKLIEDIAEGISSLLEISVENMDAHERSTRFFGTVILVNETLPWKTIRPQELDGMPSRVRKIIDGQQRLSTFSIMSILLHSRINKHLRIIEAKNSKVDQAILEKLKECARPYLEDLSDLFSSDFRKGTPTRKPVIIQGSSDKWVYDGDIEQNYVSDLTKYLARYISGLLLGNFDTDYSGDNSQLGITISTINDEFNNFEKTTESNGHMPNTLNIITNANQQDLWGRNRSDLISEINSYTNIDEIHKSQSSVCSLVQIFMYCHYMLYRCCFTTIDLSDEDLAFDIFQSLNSTGTPLTAIETFKPQVMNLTDDLDGNYEKSLTKKYFDKVDNLFDYKEAKKQKGANNNFLIILALVWNGKRIGNLFSEQRKFLLENFSKEKGDEGKADREKFIRVMGRLAEYWKNTQLPSLKSDKLGLSKLSTDQLDKIMLYLSYLKDAGHKLSNSVISRYYLEVIEDDLESQKNFLDAVQAVVAFFTLWRSARPNAGLDSVYRKLLLEQLSFDKTGEVNTPTVSFLKTLLLDALKSVGIDDESSWVVEASKNLTYRNAPKHLCRFALLAVFDNSIEDVNRPGMLSIAAPGYSTYLTFENWRGEDLKTLEHIAPQTSTTAWLPSLYEQKRIDQIGNLTLLPVSINSSAGNRGWPEKWYYYAHMAEGSRERREILGAEALSEGIALSEETLEKLTDTKYHQHMKALVTIGKTATWDHSIVEERTEQICSILWKRLYGWLN